MEECIRSQLYGDKNFPTFEEMKNNVSMVFVNTHFSEGSIRPNVPALVEIGGIQIKDKPDPLPKDILEHIEAAKNNGAILFSLGSSMKSTDLKREIVEAIFRVLSSLKENVIWKWDDLKNLPGSSKNILYKPWLPQDDILAHPNIKLFITHAGKGGTTEAQFHGVPMVALPIFGDQNANAKVITASGYGLYLELYKLTENDFKTVLMEVLNNETYTENVKRFSKLYRDRPLTAKENLVFWSEYVIRHHGAPHIQSPLKHMNIIESANLDVIAFLILVLYIVYKLLKLIIKLLFKLCTKKQKQNLKVKKQ